MAKTKMTADAVHERQRQYVATADFEGLTVGAAFVRSIRDLGYKHTGTATDEHIDNAIEQGATNIHVAFGFDGSSDAKPDALAIIDDGFGMVPGMVKASVIWGGTDRENSRTGFGRYGYGLPSAAISQGKRFTVFSRTETDTDFFAVGLDVDEISAGKLIGPSGKLEVPEPAVATLPMWLVQYANDHFPGALPAVRTVVLMEKLDRLSWRTTKALERNLLEHYGVVYRNWLRNTAIGVNGTTVEPLDPLFTTPGARFFDLDEDRAEPVEPIEFDVKDDDGRKALGKVRVRMSYMPPTFQRKDKSKTTSRGNDNARMHVLKEHNGLIVLRNGRQIDVVTKTPETTFKIWDRNIGIEIDFPPSLDEEFNVTTAKQQIGLSDRMWDLLRQQGLWRALETLRKRNTEDRSDIDSSWDVKPTDDKRPSEAVMEELEEVKRPTAVNPEREKQAEDNLAREIDRIARETGIDTETLEQKFTQQATERPFKVEREVMPGAPFFRLEQRGGQKVLLINKAHRFFTDVYASVGGVEGARVRAGLELLLFVLGDCELDATENVRQVYAMERNQWSVRLDAALGLLEGWLDTADLEPDEEMSEEAVAG